MNRAVFDLETDGFLDAVTKIHSLVIRDLDSDKVISCADQPGHTPVADGLEILSRMDLIVGHNCIKYDIPVIRKLHPEWSVDESKVRDTMTRTRFLWAHVKDADFKRAASGKLPAHLIGLHSLEAWGYRLGVNKGDYGKQEDAWEVWTPEMQRYCVQDTQVTKVLHQRCESELDKRLNYRADDIEHQLAWYLAQMERNGVPFNMDAATDLYSMLSARREELGRELREEFGWWYTSGGVADPKRGNKNRGITEGCPYTRLKVVEFNPSSRDHIAARLQLLHGWQPTEFTNGGKPQVDEDTLAGLAHIPAAAKVIEYLMVVKRIGQLAEVSKSGKGIPWLVAATDKGYQGGALTGCFHIHGSINQNGAVTHRATHAFPNLGQVPKVGKPHGLECRSLFTVPDGWVMLGSDASGLELRCLAHYMGFYDGGEYGKIILEADVHAANRDALELDGKEGRDKAKTFIYAFLYGSGPENLGALLEPTWTPEKQKALGMKLRKRFLKNLPALDYLIDSVKAKANDPGYVIMPDGRRSYVRSAHAALNTLLQGAGAIICKLWIIEFSKRMTERFGPQGWDGLWAALLWVHDEIEVAVRPEIAEEAKQVAIDSIRAITEAFEWRIPLDGEAQLGKTWADVH